MKLTTKAQGRELSKDVGKEVLGELKELGQYAGREYAKLGGDICDELGFFFLGVRRSNPKRRR